MSIPHINGTGPIDRQGQWYGPSPRVMFGSEYPGKDELKTGRGLTGPSGQILWPLVFRETGLEYEMTWVTNLVKEPMRAEWEKKGIPDFVLQTYGDELENEMRMVQPGVVFAMGRHIIRHFLGPWANVEITNAKHYVVERDWGKVSIVPAMHTAAGIRDGSKLAWTQEAIETLARVLRGPVPEPVKPDTGTVKVYESWDEYYDDFLEFYEGFEGLDAAMDTEFDSTGALMLSFAIDPHHALVLRADQVEDIKKLRAWLIRHHPRIVLHYALADLGPLRQLGIDIRELDLPLVDTGILAFHQQTEPLGLKALVRRWLGRPMRDFDDVVGPYHEVELREYMARAKWATSPGWGAPRYGKPRPLSKKERAHYEGLGLTPPMRPGRQLKPKKEPASRIHKLLRGALRDLEKKPGTDLWARWKGWEKKNVTPEIEEFAGPVPERSLSLVPRREASQYSGEDSAGTIGILPKLEALSYSPTVEVIDHDVIPQTDDMHHAGLKADLKAQRELDLYLEEEIAKTREVLRILTDDPKFNPRSADQVRAKLFGYKKVGKGTLLYMPEPDEEYAAPIQFTKGSHLPSTDKKVLSLLKDQHHLPVYLLEFRLLDKLRGTYVHPIPKWLDAGGFLYPHFSLTRVPSGRLAASDPNVMAFPKRSKLGKMVRALFVAEEGWLFGEWDHGQVELRVMADDADDEAMLRELQPGAADMHRSNAKMLFGLDADVWDDAYWEGEGKDIRDMSKIQTYGIAYGASPERQHFESRVAGFTKYDVDDYRRFTKEWFRKYKGVDNRVRYVEQFIRQHGYIADRWGRRRKLPAVFLQGYRWPLSALREEAVRQGFNHTIQGGAQGFMKRAQYRAQTEVFPAVRRAGHQVKPTLQIHDALDVKYTIGAWDVLNPMMEWAMTADSWMMRCPIITDSATGPSWAGMKKGGTK